MRSLGRRLFLGLGAAALSAVASADYLVSDLKILRTPEVVFSAVYLAPRQYGTGADYRPSVVGTKLKNAALMLGIEGGDFIVDEFSDFYARDDAAMRYIRGTLAPSLENGRILDGRSSVLLLYRRSVRGPDRPSRAKLVGVLKASWVTPEAPRLSLEEGLPAPFPMTTDLQPPPDPQPGRGPRVEREETRELKHLAVLEGMPEDTVALLAWFGSRYGVFGERFEAQESMPVRHIYSRARAFYVRCVLKELAIYYRRRAGFVVDETLSGPAGIVLRLDAADWNEERILGTGLPGRVGVRTLIERGTVETVTNVDFIKTLDLWKHQGRLPDLPELVARVRDGTFVPVTEAERCAHALIGRAPGTRISPGFRGTSNP